MKDWLRLFNLSFIADTDWNKNDYKGGNLNGHVTDGSVKTLCIENAWLGVESISYYFPYVRNISIQSFVNEASVKHQIKGYSQSTPIDLETRELKIQLLLFALGYESNHGDGVFKVD